LKENIVDCIVSKFSLITTKRNNENSFAFLNGILRALLEFHPNWSDSSLSLKILESIEVLLDHELDVFITHHVSRSKGDVRRFFLNSLFSNGKLPCHVFLIMRNILIAEAGITKETFNHHWNKASFSPEIIQYNPAKVGLFSKTIDICSKYFSNSIKSLKTSSNPDPDGKNIPLAVLCMVIIF
jgi:hypothetical protein